MKRKELEQKLKEVKREYNEHYDRMYNFVKTNQHLSNPEQHEELKKQEGRLYRKEVSLQKRLGIYVSDPCTHYKVGKCHTCPKETTCIYNLANFYNFTNLEVLK